MNTPHFTRTVTLSLGIALAAGASAPLHAAPDADGPDASSTVTLSPAKASLVERALDLSADRAEGRAGAITRAAARPLPFRAVVGEREFTGELIVRAKKDRAAGGVARLAPSLVASSRLAPEHVIEVPAGLSEGELAAALMATGDYVFAEPNWRLFPTGTVPNDPQFSNSWQHNRIGSADAWSLHTGESDVVVAVCDSGVDLDHPDLQNALVTGYNAATRTAQSDGGDVDDINGHGTFVAGCAAAQGNNGTGVVGTGWDMSIMPVRVTNNTDGSANTFAIREGVLWAAENGATVINVSFTGVTSGSNQSLARDVIDEGGLLFWAAGNSNALIANQAEALVAVASTTISDNKSGFSNFGPTVDIAAPGSSVRSTRRGGGYGNGSGTSFASPIGAGVGGMIFSARDELSPRDVMDILYTSADDLGAPGRDDFFGNGRVNTATAVEMAQTYIPRAPLPIDEPFESISWTQTLEVVSGDPATAPGADGDALALNGGDAVRTAPLEVRSIPTDTPVFSLTIDPSGAEPGDALAVEYKREDGSWDEVYTYAAHAGSPDGPFGVADRIPDAYAWHGTRVRVTAQGGADPDWLIDDFAIRPDIAVSAPPFVESFVTGHISDIDWVTRDGVETSVSLGTYAATLDDGDTLESRDFDMNPLGGTAFLSLTAWRDGACGSGTVGVEMLNISTPPVWVQVATLEPGSIGTTPERLSVELPFEIAFAANTRVRLVAEGDCVYRIDDITLDGQGATPPCVAADIAPDFGVIDFADLNTFIVAFSSGDPIADLSGDGSVGFEDVNLFTTQFSQGCP